ncbi:carboxy-terminal kinesin 2-like isoform X2 [Pomacea canaliculata]|uniref:carboxy-terminal kinesin 2-like isoform X2 n=1 Tax=Pomacea canaliculata TaxID=400727 RepID=UPI000D72D579|nr:carboxy-terminal kinesin 2-like isoform X2 [Pomacea canaliculata]
MEAKRKPLATKNGLSRLPMPGSRLKPPQTIKRARSPSDEELPVKKSKLEPAEVSNTENLSANNVFSARSSSSSVSDVQPVKLKPGHPVPVRPSARVNVSLASTRSALPSKKTVGSFASRHPTSSSAKPVGSKAPAKTSHKGPINGGLGANAGKTGSNSSSGVGKKRPAWDLKGRLQDMESVLSQREASASSLQSQLESYNQRIAHLEQQKEQLSGDVARRDELSQVVSRENAELQRQLRDCQEEMATACRKLQREIEDLTFSKSCLERQYATLEGELNVARTEVSRLKLSIAQLTSSQALVNAELETTKLSLDQAFRDIHARDEEIRQLRLELAGRDATIDENNQKIREHETMRRKLHNTIQELKGNIRVFCRVRPLLGEESLCTDGVIHHMSFPDPEGRVLELDRMAEMSMNESTLLASRRGNNKYEFCFDRVFQPESSQAEVFEEISQLVQSALDGYNVCIFAYGQTGSGKTYTMEGGRDDATVGMIPRAVSQIFKSAAELEDRGWKYKFQASFVEIYNETLRDLLGNHKEDTKLEIKLTGKDNAVTVTNLTTVTVSSEDQIHRLLHKASLQRSVAETKCNERSSRSHSVFQLNLAGSNSITMESCQGTLNLVDLAGSERLKDSGSEGQRLKETQAINKSLSCLGNVIMALGNKDSYIPYRNSKLTYLLQNSLGGNSKTLMFVNISPKEENFSETLNSLRFATKVNQCNIGTAQKRSK